MDKQVWLRRILAKQIRMGGILGNEKVLLAWFLNKKTWQNIVLYLILFLAFAVRIYHLGTNPPELFSDEITQVLSARTILETGRDTNGKLNLFLYNKIKLGTPISGYLSAFSTYVLGNNNFAVRLPSVLAGTLVVFLIFKLNLLLTKNKLISLISALVCALIPWAIYFSRIAWEPAFTVPFLLASIYIFINSINNKSDKGIVVSYILFATSVYASDAAEFLSPLFLMLLGIIYFKNILNNKKIHLLGGLIFAILLVPIIFVSLTNPLKSERTIKISTFAEGVNSQTLRTFAGNYIDHFTYKFLFTNGDPNLRHGTGQDGVLYWVLLPFILIGTIYLLTHIKNKENQFLILWVLAFPLGGALTNDGVPHATRTIIGYPVLILIAALGLKQMLIYIKNVYVQKIFVFIFLLILSLEFVKFTQSYFIKYPINSQGWWDYGTKNTLTFIQKNTRGDESLCLPNIEYWHEDTYTNYYLGTKNNYQITFDVNDSKCLDSDILVLPAGTNPPQNYHTIDVVDNLQGQTIWNVYRSVN